jgi:hypothetical protein
MTKKKYKRDRPEIKREALMRASEEGVTDTIALVAAMSQTVEQLSRNIATALVAASAESLR